MTHISRTPLALIAALTLASCAGHMTKKDCEEKDFYAQGLEDGQKGRDTSAGEKVRNTCSAYGVNNAFDRYDYGRKVGMAQYCSEGRAKDDVKDGKNDSICLKENIPPYQAAYQAAVAQKRAEKQEELNKLQKKQEKVQSELNKLN